MSVVMLPHNPTMMPPAAAQPQPFQPIPGPNPADMAAQQATSEAEQLLTDEEFTKLKNRVKNSYSQLDTFRKKRLQTIKQYVGNALGAGVADMPHDHDSLVNMLDQMAEVYMQKLASGNPQCLVLTNKLMYRAQARYFQLALNYVLRHIGFRESVKMGVLESMFSMLIMKVGVEDPKLSRRNYPFDVSAMPFVDCVWFEDWVHDTTVTRMDECRFFGDKYEVDKDDLKNDARNNKEVLEALASGPPSALDGGGGSDSATDLGGKTAAFGEGEDKDRVWLWDIWVPRKGIIVTYPKEGSEKPLRVVKWGGPPTGPYRVGRYRLVPNQILPKPPAVEVAPLADLHNRLFEKLGRQASRQKVVGFATLQGGADAEKIVRAEDGQIINVQHPEAVKQMSFGGVDQGNLTFSQVVKSEASFAGGNLEAMGGLSTEADTLGQEQLLQQNSSGRIQSMQTVVNEVIIGLIRDVGWYLWNDPLVRVTVTDKIPQTDISVEVNWPQQQQPDGMTRDLREGEYNDLNFQIVPYSMVDRTPEQRMQQIMQIWNTVLLPIAPMLQQQGVNLDVQQFLKLIEEYSGLSELSSIIQMSGVAPDPAEEQPTNLPTAGKPAATTRVYDNRHGGQKQSPVGQLIGGMSKTGDQRQGVS